MDRGDVTEDRASSCEKADLKGAIEYLNRFQFHGFKLGLERMEAVLARLGMPQTRYPVIHVAGSNGKGSTCAALVSILTEAGYSCGFYSSPHLFRLNERFMIGKETIPDDELCQLILRIKELVDQGCELSYFEYTTAMAMAWFAQKGVDVAVLETGLGGRLDATNVIERPVMTIITTVSLEHQHWLGQTIEEIAWEKAGIIKPGCPVISTVGDKRAARVIEERARELKSPIYRLGREFEAEPDGPNLDFRFGQIYMKELEFGLAGRHQAGNAAAACAAAILLDRAGFKVDEPAVRAGLLKTSWPCRCELLHLDSKDLPALLLDGAHNLEGISALREYIKALDARHPFRGKALLWACSNEGGDKPFWELLQMVSPMFQRVVITEPPGPRVPVKVEQWRERLGIPEGGHRACKHGGTRFTLEQDWKKGLKELLAATGPEDLITVAGSLYLAGIVREAIISGSC